LVIFDELVGVSIGFENVIEKNTIYINAASLVPTEKEETDYFLSAA